jgi:hypothetical protein
VAQGVEAEQRTPACSAALKNKTKSNYSRLNAKATMLESFAITEGTSNPVILI